MDITQFTVYDPKQLWIFQSGSGVFVYGNSGAGKTQFIARCLMCMPELFKPGDDVRRLIVCFRMWQPFYDHLKDWFTARGQQCIFHDCSSAKDIPIAELYNEIGADKFSLATTGVVADEGTDGGAGTTCVWFDDITSTFSSGTTAKLYDMINVGARHRRLIIFITAHSITKNMSGSHASLLNLLQCCSVHVFFGDSRSVRDTDQYARFYGQDKERRRLLKVGFKIISTLHYACLILTSNKNIDQKLRFRIMFSDGSFAFMPDL